MKNSMLDIAFVGASSFTTPGGGGGGGGGGLNPYGTVITPSSGNLSLGDTVEFTFASPPAGAYSAIHAFDSDNPGNPFFDIVSVPPDQASFTFTLRVSPFGYPIPAKIKLTHFYYVAYPADMGSVTSDEYTYV